MPSDVLSNNERLQQLTRAIVNVTWQIFVRTKYDIFCVYLRFHYYHSVDTFAGGQLISEGIVRPVGSVSALTWFIRYIYY
jgi:hypothetical protein